MSTPSRWRLLWLAPVAAASVLTLVASSSFEDQGPKAPTTGDFVLGSLPAPLVRDRGDRTVTITALRLAGSYDARAGDDLTLERSNLTLDATSGFHVELLADDPNNGLSGSLTMSVLVALDVWIGHDPTVGQLSILADGTTTLVTPQQNPAGVTVETGNAGGQTYTWNDFRDAADDDNAAHALRLAAEAYNTIADVMRLALLGEDVMAATERERDTLESMGLDSPLDLSCDNLSSDAAGDSVLLWRVDAAGSDEGKLGPGDGLEARFENCRDAVLERYREGTILIDGYTPARGDTPRTLAGQLDFGTLFIAEGQVDINTVPDPASPRVDGGLDLQYDEALQTTQ
jgi:hypothetical protein